MSNVKFLSAVDSVISSRNDSTPDVTLELCDESPPKFDHAFPFDFCSSLSKCEKNSDKCDNVLKRNTGHDNELSFLYTPMELEKEIDGTTSFLNDKIEFCAPTSKKDSSKMPATESFNHESSFHDTEISLSSLAESHFLENETCKTFEKSDHVLYGTLADLLTETSVLLGKNVPDEPACNFGPKHVDKSSDTDGIDALSLLLNSSNVVNSASSSSLSHAKTCNGHILNDKESSSYADSPKLVSSDDTESGLSLADLILSENKTNGYSLNENVKCEEVTFNKRFVGNGYEFCDDDVIPSIDLKMCIKKCDVDKDCTVKQSKHLLGIDNADISFNCSDIKLSTYFSVLENEVIMLKNLCPSLLSKALSCKPSSNKIKSEKMKSIRNQLLQNQFNSGLMICRGKRIIVNNKRFEDRSNNCVLPLKGRFSV